MSAYNSKTTRAQFIEIVDSLLEQRDAEIAANAELRMQLAKSEERRRYEGAAYQAKLRAAKGGAPSGESFAARCAARTAAAKHLGQELGRGATRAEVDEYLARA